MHEGEMCIVSLLMFVMGAAPAGDAARETQNWDADGLSAWTVGSQKESILKSCVTDPISVLIQNKPLNWKASP